MLSWTSCRSCSLASSRLEGGCTVAPRVSGIAQCGGRLRPLFVCECPHCSRRLRFIRFDWRMISPPDPQGTTSPLRGGSVLESILSNAKVQLRACQSKSPCRPRFVAAAVLQDLGNGGAFDDAQ